MVDGSIVIDTEIDKSGITNAGQMLKQSLSRISKGMARAFGGKPTAAAEKNIQKLKEKYDEATAAVERQRKAIAKLQAEQAAAPAARQAEANAKIAELEPQAAAWKERFESKDAQALHLYNNGQANSEEFKELHKEAEEAYKEYEKISAQIEKIKSQTAALASKETAAYTGKIEAANTKLTQLEAQASKTKAQMQEALDERQPSRFSKSLSKSAGSVTKFTKRVAGLAKRVLVFSVITRMLRSLRTLLSGMFGSNSQLTSSLARIKGNLLTAFQPIYKYILPGIQKVLAVIEVVTAKLAALSAALFGKSVTQMQQNAKALNAQANATKKAGKEAEKAKRSLAGFDELNQLSGNEKDADSESETKGADFSGKVSDLTAQEQKIATYALLLLGTGLLLVGIFTVNFTMIITGAVLIKAGLDLGKSSGTFASNPPWLNQIISWGTILVGLAMLIIGAATANIPLAVAGAALIGIGFAYGKASGAFDSMPTWVKQVITWGTIVVGLALLIAGCIMGFNPAMIVAGIALMGLGIAFGASTGSFDVAFNAISNFFKNVWNWIKDFWNNHISKVFTKEFWDDLWLKIKDALIRFVDWIDVKLTTAGDNLRAWWNAHIGFFFTKEWWAQKWQNVRNAAHEKVAEIKNGIVSAFTTVREKIDYILESIKTKFSNIWSGIRTLVIDVVNGIISAIEGLVNGLIRGINKMVQAINAIHVDIPDWVPTYGGKRIGFNLPTIKEVTIPRLATGTVVPANYGEYVAILGDNKREPEVVSPLSTIKQAVIEAVTQINNGNQPMTVVINLDGATIGKAALKYQQGRNVQMGAKA